MTKHKWNIEVRIPASETTDGNDHTERQCPFCGTWRITVHPPRGYAWREWRGRDGKQFRSDTTPPCELVATLDVPAI